MIHQLFIVLILYDNRVMSSEPFLTFSDAQSRAVQLSNEWYKQEGIEAFDKTQLETFEEMQSYFRSDAYHESGDDAHICIEEVVVKDQP